MRNPFTRRRRERERMEAMIREVAMFRSSLPLPYFISPEEYYSEPYFAREAVVLIESLDTVGDT